MTFAIGDAVTVTKINQGIYTTKQYPVTLGSVGQIAGFVAAGDGYVVDFFGFGYAGMPAEWLAKYETAYRMPDITPSPMTFDRLTKLVQADGIGTSAMFAIFHDGLGKYTIATMCYDLSDRTKRTIEAECPVDAQFKFTRFG